MVEREGQLFDLVPRGVELTSEQVRLLYDGTILNGVNGLEVEFDQKGEVVKVRSFNLYTKQESPAITRGEGTWQGEAGYYTISGVFSRKLDAIVMSAKKQWHQWETRTDYPNIEFRVWKQMNFIKQKIVSIENQTQLSRSALNLKQIKNFTDHLFNAAVLAAEADEEDLVEAAVNLLKIGGSQIKTKYQSAARFSDMFTELGSLLMTMEEEALFNMVEERGLRLNLHRFPENLVKYAEIARLEFDIDWLLDHPAIK